MESVCPRGQGLKVTSSRKIGKYYGLGEANVVLFFGRRRSCIPNAAKPRGSIFTNDRKVLLFSIREAKVVHAQRSKTSWFDLPENSKSITDLAKPMSSIREMKYVRIQRGKTRSSIFPKNRKVLLSSLREPSRSPLLSKHRFTQTKLPHPTTVAPTHRQVRSAIPTRFILGLPRPCSRALNVAER